VRHWTERAGAQFPTVIDAENQFGALLGFKAIPNGLLLDPHGIIRYAKFGGFDVGNSADLAAIEAAVREHGPSPQAGSVNPDVHQAPTRVDALLRDGVRRLALGDRDGGLAAWRAALAIDPDNFVIRKQLWRAEHPDRFGEEIDFDWQKQQLARERAAEAAGRS